MKENLFAKENLKYRFNIDGMKTVGALKNISIARFFMIYYSDHVLTYWLNACVEDQKLQQYLHYNYKICRKYAQYLHKT